MPFILIAKAADGQLRLLTESSFESRGEALSELSRITADPSFDRWDDEVLALNLDSGTPVLLVRPADTGAAVSGEAVEETETPIAAEEAAGEVEEEAETAFAAEADDIGDGEEADGACEEGAPSLKDALKRTTVQLEAEGIVAPESVGPAPAESEDDASESSEVEEDNVAESDTETPSEDGPEADAAQAAAAWPWATGSEEKKFDLDALEAPGNDEGSLVRAPGDDETMSFARPVIMGAYGEESAPVVAEETVEPAEDDLPAETEPETAESAADSEPETSEPASEPEPEAPVVEADTESTDVSETAAGTQSEAESATTPGEIEFAPDVTLDVPVAEVPLEAAVGEPAPEPVAASSSMGASEPSTDDAIDDLLADVSAASAEPLQAEDSSDFVELPSTSTTPPIDTMTCDDCVYTDSCPNKGQMAPSSCGSFQWK